MQNTHTCFNFARKAEQRLHRRTTGVTTRALATAAFLGAIGLTAPAPVWADEPSATKTTTTTSQTTTTIVTSQGTTIMVGTTKIEVPQGATVTITGPTTVSAGATIATAPATTAAEPATTAAAPATTAAAPAPKPPTASEARLARGKQSLKAIDYAAAEQAARESLALAKTTLGKGNARMFLGQTFYSRKRYAEARTEWNKVALLGNADLTLRAHLGVARSYLAQDNLDAAVAQYKSTIAMVAANPKSDAEDKVGNGLVVSLPLAAIYFKRGQLDAARDQFARFAQPNPDTVEIAAYARFAVGAVEFLQKKPEAAANTFKQATTQLLSLKSADAALTDAQLEKLQKISQASGSLFNDPSLQNLSGPEIGSKVIEVLVSSFGDAVDDFFAEDAED